MKRICVYMLAVVILTAGCGSNTGGQVSLPNVKGIEGFEIVIEREPSATKYDWWKREYVMSNFIETKPHFGEVDFRCLDVSTYDLKDYGEVLKYVSFDTITKWPDKLPDGFIPEEIIENGKSPGLGIEALHEEGITGRGVSVAIIDDNLLVSHKEYKDNIMVYEEIGDNEESYASMHGTAIASILVGNDTGVAPDANLFYYSTSLANPDSSESHAHYLFGCVEAIERILEINSTLDDEDKIRVISLSMTWRRFDTGIDEMVAIIEKAESEGILIVSANIGRNGNGVVGMGRKWLSDPDVAGNYCTELHPNKSSSSVSSYVMGNKNVLVPEGYITTAAPAGDDEYVFWSYGGTSWAIPYGAGVYALACQVDPKITPDEFWKIALETSDSFVEVIDGREYEVHGVINPKGIMDVLRK